MAYDPFIGHPMVGKPNPELNRPTRQQRAMLAFVVWGFAVLVLALVYWLIGIRH